MPEYESPDERPDRTDLYEYGLEEMVPDQFEFTITGGMPHPELHIQLVGDRVPGLHIYDRRVAYLDVEKVCCRVGPTARVLTPQEIQHADFDTLDEAAGWLDEATKALVNDQQEQSTVEQSLDGQIQLDDQ